VAALDPSAFAVHRATPAGAEIAYLREGVSGHPLLLLHGWPETMRVWWRNIHPLAAAGFEVIVPDLRGFGLSGLAPDDRYDAAAHAHDMDGLVRGELGHERVTVCAGDLGGVVAQDLSLRFPGLVDRLILFNTIPPVLPDSPREIPREVRMAADYFVRHATDADGLAAELATPELRRAYVAQFYGSRFWASPGSFAADDVAFMTEPFAAADRFRASIANYEYAGGPRRSPERILLTEVNPTPTLILYGPDDHVIPRDFCRRMEAAFPERAGPFVVENAGHFLQWERADVLNGAVRWLCSPLR